MSLKKNLCHHFLARENERKEKAEKKVDFRSSKRLELGDTGGAPGEMDLG